MNERSIEPLIIEAIAGPLATAYAALGSRPLEARALMNLAHDLEGAVNFLPLTDAHRPAVVTAHLTHTGHMLRALAHAAAAREQALHHQFAGLETGISEICARLQRLTFLALADCIKAIQTWRTTTQEDQTNA